MGRLRTSTFLLGLTIVLLALYGFTLSCWEQNCWGDSTPLRDGAGIGFHSLFFLFPGPDALNNTLRFNHWSFYIALFLTPFFTLSVVLQTLKAFASQIFAQLSLRFYNQHTIIFGSGVRAQALAKDCAMKGNKVVFIAPVFAPDMVAICKDAYIPMISLAQPLARALLSAKAHKATYIICAQDDDLEGCQTALDVKFNLEAQGQWALAENTLQILTNDRSFQSSLQPNSRKHHTIGKIRIDLVDLRENSIRSFIAENPFYPNALTAKRERLHFLFYEFSAYAEDLLYQALKTSIHDALQPAKVTILCIDSVSLKSRLEEKLPEINKVAEFEFIECPSIDAAIPLISNQAITLSAVFISNSQEGILIRMASKIRTLALNQADWSAPIVMISSNLHRFTQAVNKASENSAAPLLAIGELSNGLSISDCTGGVDKLAKTIHRAYLNENSRRLNDQQSDTHAYVPWERLGEDYRSNNRRAADHITTKRHIYPEVSDGLFETDLQMEKLAELEHQAWNMERRLAGWSHGPRDDMARTHPDLIPYKKLTEEIKAYDRQQVRFIDRLLKEG